MADLGYARSRFAASIIIMSLALAMLGAPAQAAGREKGEFWAFEMTLSADILGMRAEVSGPITFTVEGEAAMIVGGTDYSTDVINMKGSLNGSVYMFDRMVGGVELSLSGTQHEVIGSLGILEENVTAISDITLDAGLISFSYHVQEQVIVVSDPPILSDFDPDSASVGDSSTKAVELVTASRTWENGQVTNTTEGRSNLTYSLAVIAAEPVETPSGTHSALKVRVSDDAGNYDFYWWSAEVGYFVKHELYGPGMEQPTMTLVLKDYGTTVSSDWTLYVIVGVVIFMAAAVVLALVVLRKRPGMT